MLSIGSWLLTGGQRKVSASHYPSELPSEVFERSFTQLELPAAIGACANHELAEFFVSRLRQNQPVLEAGCGSGKWLHYLKQRGVECVGIDWSHALQRRSLDHDPDVRFDAGDLRCLPYADNSFGAVLALGSIEHVIEGPAAILREFHRVLRPDGVAVVTAPHLSSLKRLSESAKDVLGLRESKTLRRILRRQPIQDGTRREVIASGYSPTVHMDLGIHDGAYVFFQYAFKPTQLLDEIRSAGFEPKEAFPTASAFGLQQYSYGLLGSLDIGKESVALNPVGKLLDSLLPARLTGRMFCVVATLSK